MFKTPLKNEPIKSTVQCDAASTPGDAACTPAVFRVQFWREPSRRAVFGEEAKGAATLMFKWLTLAFVIESLVVTYLPTELIAGYVGASNSMAIPISVAVGIPSYVDGYAALPLVRGLMELGMAPGAAALHRRL